MRWRMNAHGQGKQSAVKLVSEGENKGRRREHKLAEKQDIAFSKSVVEIKSRKIKSEFLPVCKFECGERKRGQLPRN